uniref:2S albumin n=1 Tax=Vernicia fordii TaxID=73154 RepID=J3S6X8_VERFO|nr:2S albumin [Vernicia fordii]
MPKLTFLLASFIALLLLVDASIYRTNVIVQDDADADADADAENQSSYQGYRTSCGVQIQRQQKLRRCQEYIRQQMASTRRAYDNQWRVRQECCNQLQRVDARCRCNGLTQAIQQQESEGRLQGFDVRQAFNLARELPSECGVSPRVCRFQQRWGF